MQLFAIVNNICITTTFVVIYCVFEHFHLNANQKGELGIFEMGLFRLSCTVILHAGILPAVDQSTPPLVYYNKATRRLKSF